MKKIVVASDSFKGCLSSLKVADAVKTAITAVYPYCEVLCVPMADGGEGTMVSLVEATGGYFVSCDTYDPLMRPVRASYGMLGDGETAVIEIAEASGLPLLAPEEYNPEKTTTYGTGIIMAKALQKGVRKFILALGGSATNDAATGWLSALGYRFLDICGKEIYPVGGNLNKIVTIDESYIMPELKNISVQIACDVDNPLYGVYGAAYMFSPQKGADGAMIRRLDEGLRSFARIVRHEYNNLDVFPGAGAAGGAGYGLKVFLNAELVRGAYCVMTALHFDDLLKDADMVVTGEGCIDIQTLCGKVLVAVASEAHKYAIPVWAIGGRTENVPGLKEKGIARVITITPPDMPLEVAMDPQIASSNIISAVQEHLYELENSPN